MSKVKIHICDCPDCPHHRASAGRKKSRRSEFVTRDEFNEGIVERLEAIEKRLDEIPRKVTTPFVLHALDGFEN
jgi:hypothetical protein